MKPEIAISVRDLRMRRLSVRFFACDEQDLLRTDYDLSMWGMTRYRDIVALDSISLVDVVRMRFEQSDTEVKCGPGSTLRKQRYRRLFAR